MPQFYPYIYIYIYFESEFYPYLNTRGFEIFNLN